MDEEGSQREEVKGSPHAGTQNNTAGSGEERTPQVARKLELGSQVRTKSSVKRSSSLSSMRRKNKARTALRQERLSPIADTVKKERDNNTGHRALSSDTESSDDAVIKSILLC